MYRLIGLSFTIKGQSFPDQILPVLNHIAANIAADGETVLFVNGHMPKHVVLEKGFDPFMCDKLAELFPLQVNCYYNGKTQRQEMYNLLNEFGSEVYVIGEVTAGVKEEADLYAESPTIKVFYVPLDWDGTPEYFTTKKIDS